MSIPLNRGTSMRKNITVKQNCMVAMIMPLCMMNMQVFAVVL